jgi:Cold shock proteins
MLKGTVKWFNEAQGYGFIEVAGQRDVFVHYSAIRAGARKPLAEGQEVEFDLSAEAKEPEARDVTEGRDGGADEDAPEDDAE